MGDSDANIVSARKGRAYIPTQRQTERQTRREAVEEGVIRGG